MNIENQALQKKQVFDLKNQDFLKSSLLHRQHIISHSIAVNNVGRFQQDQRKTLRRRSVRTPPPAPAPTSLQSSTGESPLREQWPSSSTHCRF